MKKLWKSSVQMNTIYAWDKTLWFFPNKCRHANASEGVSKKSFQWLLIWLLKLLQLLLCPDFSQPAFFSPKWNPSEDFIKFRNNIIHFLCAKARGASQHGSSKVWLGYQARLSCWALNPELSRMWGGGFLRLNGHSSNPWAKEWIAQS